MTLAEMEPHRDPWSGMVRDTFVRVVARAHGRDELVETRAVDGDPWRAGTRPDWAWLARKASNFLGDASLVETLRAMAGDAPASAIPLAGPA
jgi:hypothetical protein